MGRKISNLFRSIQWKMVFLYVLMTLVVMEVVSIYLVDNIENVTMQSFVAELTTKANILADNVSKYLEDWDAISREEKKLRIYDPVENKGIKVLVREELEYKSPVKDHIAVLDREYRLLVFDKQWDVFSSTQHAIDLTQQLSPANQPPERWVDSLLLQASLKNDTIYRIFREEEEGIAKRKLVMVVPVKSALEPDPISGYVLLKVSLYDEVDKTVAHIKKILFNGTMVTVAITIILGLALSRTIAKPVRELTLQASAMARGNFDQRIDVKSNDEIGQLSEMFNSLAAQLKSTLTQISNEKSKVEAILTYMSNGVIAFDESGKLLHVNPKARELLGLVHEEGPPLITEILTKLSEHQDSLLESTQPYSREITYDDKVLRIQYAPIHKNEFSAGIILVLQDITEQDRLEQMRRDFVANVSHELKTPLTNIKIRTQTLMEYYNERKLRTRELVAMLRAGWRVLGYGEREIQQLLPADCDDLYDLTYRQLEELYSRQVLELHKRLLPVIEAEADRMDKLVRNLLQLSQLESQKLEFDDKPVVLQELLRTVVERMSTAASEKGLELFLQLSDEVPPVPGSSDKLEQVIVNIISNAVKYTPAGGTITAALTAEPGCAVVSVRDTGIGIPKKDLPRLFERFYRVDKARSREQGGTGLGLSIAKQIVEAHGGEIRISSEVGKGTEVVFTVPYGTDPPEER